MFVARSKKMPLRDAGSVLLPVEFSPAEVEDQLARVTHSQAFRGSALLQQFLRYITEKTVAGHASEINEYSIATQVFGRAPDFNPSVDTIVRTQAYRLRQKLSDYYESEGRADAILIAIPKGHYVPSFSAREVSEAPAPVEQDFVARRPSRGWWILPLTTAAAFLLGALFSLLFHREKVQSAEVPATDLFWTSFLRSDKEPIVAYTNPLYLADGYGDLFVFRKGVSGDRGALADPETTRRVLNDRNVPPGEPLYFADDVTGVSDLLAALSVQNAITRAGGKPMFKRGRLLTTYDLETHNVVFIGSPFVNEVMDDLPNRPRFLFTRNDANHRLWSARIEDTAHARNAPEFYSIERAPESGTIVSDYAIITGLPGLKPNRRILILAGLTTSGTAAAARCASSPEDLLAMQHRLPGAHGTWPPYFEFLLKVQLNRGLDVVSWRTIAAHY